MALSHKAKKRWSLFILVVVMPIYIVVAINLVALVSNAMGRPSVLLEFLMFVVLGVVWVFPFKRIFQGVGAAAPEDERD